MRDNTFKDDIRSALKSVCACAHAVRLCDRAFEHKQFNQVIGKINMCAMLVRHVDSLLNDHRGLRASKPGRATAWEIRTTLGLPENANINGYSGKVNPDGSVDVWDDNYYGKRGGKLIGHAEASALDQAVVNKGKIGSFASGYSPSSLLGGLNSVKSGINTVANKNIGGFYNRSSFNGDPSEDKSVLVRSLAQVGKVAKLTAEIAGIISLIKFSGAGDSLAEGAKQISRFKNWAGETITKLKNKINGRR